jgi:prevent-host-death family protein
VSFEVLPRAQQLIDALLFEQVEMAFASVALDHPMLETRTIGHWELVCLFRQGDSLARVATVTPGDVADESFVAFHGDTLQGRMVGEWLQGESVTVAARALVRSGQAAAALVASGVGIALVDNLTVIAAEAQNRFGELLDAAQREPVGITRRGRTVAFVVSPREYESLAQGRATEHSKGLAAAARAAVAAFRGSGAGGGAARLVVERDAERKAERKAERGAPPKARRTAITKPRGTRRA